MVVNKRLFAVTSNNSKSNCYFLPQLRPRTLDNFIQFSKYISLIYSRCLSLLFKKARSKSWLRLGPLFISLENTTKKTNSFGTGYNLKLTNEQMSFFEIHFAHMMKHAMKLTVCFNENFVSSLMVSIIKLCEGHLS